MSLFMIVGISLIVLTVLLVLVFQMPEAAEKKKKVKREPPPEQPKDWQGIAERAERRAKAIENMLKTAQNDLKDKDKVLEEMRSTMKGLERRVEQEKTWREKEEREVEKERGQEKMLSAELAKTREALDRESTGRIKLDYEVRELTRIREEHLEKVRKLSAENMALEKKVQTMADDNRSLRVENTELKKKKEADQWIAKDDYVALEKELKRARWETEQFKKQVPVGSWPKALQPRPADQNNNPPVDPGKVGQDQPRSAE